MANDPSFQMGWRYVTYRREKRAVSFTIEPMVKGPDIVYFPTKSSWYNTAPDWLKNDRAKVYHYLKSIKWNRDLVWQESSDVPCKEIMNDAENIIPGSLESTAGGKFLEDARLFHPGQKFTFEQARQLWFEIDKKFVEQAQGKVTIFCDELIPNSVFEKIELPTLRENHNVTLDIRSRKFEMENNKYIKPEELKYAVKANFLQKFHKYIKRIF